MRQQLGTQTKTATKFIHSMIEAKETDEEYAITIVCVRKKLYFAVKLFAGCFLSVRLKIIVFSFYLSYCGETVCWMFF